MMISHAHRFVFVKPRKTAGTSVELALSPFLKSGDLATAIEPEEEPLRRMAEGVRIGVIHEGRQRLRDHSPLSKLWQAMPETRGYRVVTMCRNPWDRAVSQFFWSHRRTDMRERPFGEQRRAFNAWTQAWGPKTWLDPFYGRKRQRALDASQLYWVGGKCRAAYCIRFEQLAEDTAALGDWLRLGGRPEVAEKAKSGIRPEDGAWTRYFDEATRALVAKECAREIAMFGYDFEGKAVPTGPEISRQTATA